MIRIPIIIGLVLTTWTLSACVHTQPLKSHAHVGHALTSWHDTPGQQGLFIVAEKEIDIALQQSQEAWRAFGNAGQRTQHLENVLNALNPDLQPIGLGEGYGAIRALSGAIEHLEYAASSDDASENFVASVVGLATHGDRILERLKQAQNLSQRAIKGGTPLDRSTQEIYQLLVSAQEGEDRNKDGLIDGDGAEGGLIHMADRLQAMLKRETEPEYEPVSRKYVLGLIRLPNGSWGYRLPRRPSSRVVYSGY